MNKNKHNISCKYINIFNKILDLNKINNIYYIKQDFTNSHKYLFHLINVKYIFFFLLSFNRYLLTIKQIYKYLRNKHYESKNDAKIFNTQNYKIEFYIKSFHTRKQNSLWNFIKLASTILFLLLRVRDFCKNFEKNNALKGNFTNQRNENHEEKQKKDLYFAYFILNKLKFIKYHIYKYLENFNYYVPPYYYILKNKFDHNDSIFFKKVIIKNIQINDTYSYSSKLQKSERFEELDRIIGTKIFEQTSVQDLTENQLDDRTEILEDSIFLAEKNNIGFQNIISEEYFIVVSKAIIYDIVEKDFDYNDHNQTRFSIFLEEVIINNNTYSCSSKLQKSERFEELDRIIGTKIFEQTSVQDLTENQLDDRTEILQDSIFLAEKNNIGFQNIISDEYFMASNQITSDQDSSTSIEFNDSEERGDCLFRPVKFVWNILKCSIKKSYRYFTELFFNTEEQESYDIYHQEENKVQFNEDVFNLTCNNITYTNCQKISYDIEKFECECIKDDDLIISL